jgi:oligopeptide transport system substrate-binding protein
MFEYLFNTSEQNKQIAVELQSMWKQELGITMELRQTEWKVYLAAQGSLNYDLSRSSWVGDYNDANTFLDMFMSNNGNNRTGWKNGRYDELIREGNMQTDLKRRAELLAEAEKILVEEEVPVLPLYFYVGVNVYDPAKIGGIHGNALDLHPIWAMYRKDKPVLAARP